MLNIPIEEINTWDRFYRANFINSLQGFKPVSLIGTVDAQGRPNLAVFSNIVHIGANPALIGFINRPVEAAPHTLGNIKATLQYTINHILPSFVPAAHQSSAKFDKGINEFEQVGLTATWKEGSKAPYVAESRVQYGLQLVEVVPITHNNTFLVIGTVTQVFLEEGLLRQDGFIDLDKAQSVASLGIDGYFFEGKVHRFEYARPNKPVKENNG